MTASFGLYSEYYDLLYQDKDYSAETQYVWELLNAHLDRPPASILELGAGTGIHAGMLSDYGVNVTGVELSPDMLRAANLRAAGRTNQSSVVQFVEGDARTYRAGKTFDAVISLFHVLSYQTTNKDLLAMLRTAADHLESGGVFLFDFWYGPAVLWQRPTTRVKRWSTERIDVTRLAVPVLHDQANVVDVNYTIFVKENNSDTIGQIEETHRMRYLFLAELDAAMDEMQMERIGAEEWLTRANPSPETWGVCVVARKR